MVFYPSNCWDAPSFHLNSPNQSVDWKAFYTRALHYLDTPDIKNNEADECHKGWKQLKFMFDGDDRQALQSLMDSSTITEESMETPWHALVAIGITIKPKEHFWDLLR